MSQKGDRFLTIGHAARYAKISRDRLRDACDVGRVPYIRSTKGYRLISAETTETLRRRGLDAFPPVPKAPDPTPATDATPRRSLPGERLGLLGEPSPALRKLKESLEAAKMQLEIETVTETLSEIQDERRQKIAGRTAEERARSEREQEEQEQLRQEEAQAAAAQRQREWFAAQAKTAVELLYRKAAWIPVDLTVCQEEVAARLAEAFQKGLSKLGPDSPAREVETATRRAVDATLAPYRKAKEQKDVIESALRCIAPHLTDLQRKGWLDCAPTDVEFIAGQVKEPIRKILERESQRRELSRTQAEEIVRNGIDARFQIV